MNRNPGLLRSPLGLALLLSLGGCGSYLHDRQRDPAVDPLAQSVLDQHRDARGGAPPADAPESSAPTPDTSGGEARRGASDDDTIRPPDRSVSLQSLGDPQLTALVSEALAHQRDIQTGIATVQRSRALADAARAPRFPTANGVVSATAGQSITPGIGAVRSRSIAFTIPISYEVDLFGRYAREHRAAEAQAEAAEEDLAALSITVASEVADAWFDLTAIGERRRALEAQREIQARVLTMVEARVRQGLAPPVDAISQSELLATTDASLALLTSEREVQALRLAVLLGRSPTHASFEAPERLPELPAIAESGVSAASLASRPDVRAALLRLEAADDLVTAAVRAQLPVLRLGATPGYQILHAERAGTSQTTQGFTWNVNATLTVPIFDGLRAHATVQDRRAQVEVQLRQYEQLLYEASTEVESAVTLDRQARLQLEQLTAVRDATRRTREAVEASYRQGLVDYVRVLLAMRDELNAEASFLDSQRALLTYRMQLYRALGGDLGLEATPNP